MEDNFSCLGGHLRRQFVNQFELRIAEVVGN